MQSNPLTSATLVIPRSAINGLIEATVSAGGQVRWVPDRCCFGAEPNRCAKAGVSLLKVTRKNYPTVQRPRVSPSPGMHKLTNDCGEVTPLHDFSVIRSRRHGKSRGLDFSRGIETRLSPRCSPRCGSVVWSTHECLNINSFWSLAQGRVVISDWKHDCNRHRRHSSELPPPARYAAWPAAGRACRPAPPGRAPAPRR